MARKDAYPAQSVRFAFTQFIPEGMQESDQGELKIFCPLCEDPETSNSPSGSINPEANKYACFKNPEHSGSIVRLVEMMTLNNGFSFRSALMAGRSKDPDAVARRVAKTKETREAAETIDPDIVQQLHINLLNKANKVKLDDLMQQRGFSLDTIKKWKLGWDPKRQRYSIPVLDEYGNVKNIRLYKMGAASSDKMQSWASGTGNARLFGESILKKHDDVVLCEGETDCILLEQFGIPAVTHTGGASVWKQEWAAKFLDKNVWVAYDNDDTGHKGAIKVERALRAIANRVYILRLPLEEKGADVTDYLWKESNTAENFRDLMTAAVEAAEGGHNQTINVPAPTSGVKVSLLKSLLATHQDETLDLTVSVSGKEGEPWTAPKRITATCSMDKGPAQCALCPMMARNGHMEKAVRADDRTLLSFIDVPETRQATLLQQTIGARCKDRVEFDVDENYHIEELIVQPSVDARVEDDEEHSSATTRRQVFSVTDAQTEVNSKVRLVGRNVPDPKSGQLKFQAWVNEPVEMDIDHFTMTAETLETLEQFSAGKKERPLDRAKGIARQMAADITHIYGRELLHVGYDLVWHSPRQYMVGGELEEKGWLEMMAVGDTRTGKSEVAHKLSRWYRAGVVQSCEGMSFAGLVGGAQQIGNKWTLTWGSIVMNDRRLVVLDEVSGFSNKDGGVVEKMSSVRSSGKAQITKITGDHEAYARTRLIWVTNEMNGKALRDLPKAGISAMQSVVPKEEDQARFDFVMATANSDVTSEQINAMPEQDGPPLFSSTACELLVKWSWSLRREDILITEEAAQAARDYATEIGDRYIPDPPLLQAANARRKIMRIAVALAARTFNYDRRTRKLVVDDVHVEDAVTFLDEVYGHPSMGYKTESEKVLRSVAKARANRALIRVYLEDNLHIQNALSMLDGDKFMVREFADFAGVAQSEAQAATQALQRLGALKRSGRQFVPSPTLRDIVQEMDREDDGDEAA